MLVLLLLLLLLVVLQGRVRTAPAQQAWLSGVDRLDRVATEAKARIETGQLQEMSE